VLQSKELQLLLVNFVRRATPMITLIFYTSLSCLNSTVNVRLLPREMIKICLQSNKLQHLSFFQPQMAAAVLKTL
jgi:hypothetical protein